MPPAPVSGSGTPTEPEIVLVVDHQIPTPDQDSGSLRMIRIIGQLRALGRPVLVFPLNGQAPEPYATGLKEQGAMVIRAPEQQRRFLREQGHRIALAVLCRPQPTLEMLGTLRDAAPQCVIAYDTVDVHFRRLARRAELAETAGGTDRFTLRAQAETHQALELLLVRECDVTLVVSDEERELLNSHVPHADIRVLSNVHTPGPGVAPAPAAGARLLFVGNYLHAPNVDAARWLADEILPLVRKEVPEAALDLVGVDSSGAIAPLASAQVAVHGWVDDLAPLYARARLAVAPLRYGAGVKGKVGQAIEHTVPVVGTFVAFEGMGLIDEHHVLVGESAHELAARIVRLLRDDDLCIRLARAAPQRIAARFSPETARATLRELLAVPRKPASTCATRPGPAAPPTASFQE